MKLRLRAGIHELTCLECRVTWFSWLQRLAGVKAGHTPRPSVRKLERNRRRIAARAARRYPEALSIR